MKILSLKDVTYKNITGNTYDFSNTSNYTAFIGLNGSGKSNILEVISKIFLDLYASAKAKKYQYLSDLSNYRLEYKIHNKLVLIENGKIFINGSNIPLNQLQQYLPTKVIACYSGEENRLWDEAYAKSYSSFFKAFKKSKKMSPELLYINKYSWQFALIALLTSENDKVKCFIKNILKIDVQNSKIEIDFNLNRKNYPAFEKNESISLIKRIEEEQKNNKSITVDFRTINSFDLKQFNSEDFGAKLFEYLFITGMPIKNSEIRTHKIIEDTQIKIDGINLKDYSEGEKKLILIYLAKYILADDDSLILLDEPDAHLHLERKKDIIQIISDSDNDAYTMFTTHSPTLCKYIASNDLNNIKLLEKGKPILVQNELEVGKKLIDSDDILTLLFSTKHILIVEGKTDDLYISKALEHFDNEYQSLKFDILRIGGTDADNIKVILDKIAGNQARKIIIMTDRDDAGLKLYQTLFNNNNNTDKKNIDYALYKKNIYFLMIPPTDTQKCNGCFQIENYFGNELIRSLVNEYIEESYTDANAFTDLPNKLQDKIKQKLKTKIDDSRNMLGFKTLLNKLKFIIEIN